MAAVEMPEWLIASKPWLRFSYMALLMGEYGDAPLDFWGRGSGEFPTAAASGLAFDGYASMLVQQQAMLDELLAGED
jgi:hypothetical protein